MKFIGPMTRTNGLTRIDIFINLKGLTGGVLKLSLTLVSHYQKGVQTQKQGDFCHLQTI